MKRQVIIGSFIMALVLSGLPNGWTFAETSSSSIDQKRLDIKERDKEIQKLEKQKQLAEQEQQDALKQIEEKKSQLSALDQKVYELQEEVNQGEKKIAQLEREMSERQELFKGRLREIYLQGENFYLEQLLQSPTFGDFLTRLDHINMLMRRDQNLMKQYQKDYKQFSAAQAELQKSLAELKQQQAKAQQKFEEIQAQYQQYESTIEKYQSELEVLEEENEQASKELNALITKAAQEARERERQKELSGQSVPAYTGGKFYWPVDGGTLSSKFGPRYHPIHKEYRMHEGIDISARMGTPIKAAAPGEVIEARPSNGYGYIIVIYHGDGLSTLYAHMYAQTVKVKKGQTVDKGQVIAAVGSNGWATGPHLHFEVHQNGNPVDPMNYYR